MIDSFWFHIEDNPQLFVDDVMIEAAQGLTRRWHKPSRNGSGPLIKRDREWERAPYFTYSNYVVLQDPKDGLIKCWYEDLGEVNGTGHPWKTRLLYAESKDGVTFHKPEFTHCSYGTKPTNIVMGYMEGVEPTELNQWADQGVHSNGIVIDPHSASPDERFRTMFSESTYDSNRVHHKIVCAHSADGVHWRKYPWSPTLGSSGSHLSDVSCIHYDHDARMFVQNTRHGLMYQAVRPSGIPCVSKWFGPHLPGRPDLVARRRVFQTRSHDFQHWSDPLPVSTPEDALGATITCDNLDFGHYGMQQFRVGRMHFATLGIFRYVDNEMDVRLLFSRDGIRFTPADRGTPFLTPRGPGHWDAHMVSVTSQPIEIGAEWFFYHGGSNVHHDWWIGPSEDIDEPEAANPGSAAQDGFGLGLARLRKEGFASLDGSRQRPGFLLTKPFHSPGGRLVINARCRSGGSIRTAVLDTNRQPIEGHSLDDADVFTGDSTEHIVTWKNSSSMGRNGEFRQLLFLVCDAEIFSFRCVAA